MADRRQSAAREGGLRHPRYLLFLAVLFVLPWPLLAVLDLPEAIITAFDAAVLAFLSSCISLWRNGSPDRIRYEAGRDDAGAAMLLLLTALIAAVVLVSLTILVLDKNAISGGEVALLVTTLAASWSFTNTVYAFHYARLYYSEAAGADCGGLDFPGGEAPGFTDFVNFAFVIGMTCQTADIAITNSHMRRISTWHGLFAFVFNLGILALTVNVLAGG